MNPPFKVLLVEDDPALRDLITLSLTRTFGCQIISAEDGPQALKRFQECQPDVVILEILIPQLNGLELIRRWRKRGGSKAPIIIITSALGYQEIVQQAVVTGVKDFLIKPYNVDTLIKRLQQALDQRQAAATARPSEERSAAVAQK